MFIEAFDGLHFYATDLRKRKKQIIKRDRGGKRWDRYIL